MVRTPPFSLTLMPILMTEVKRRASESNCKGYTIKMTEAQEKGSLRFLFATGSGSEIMWIIAMCCRMG
jgi:hypothetical protein